MNLVTLVGRLARDMELRSTNTGKAVGNFSVAVDRRFKKDGQPTADFFNVVTWGKQAELIDQYLSKGDRIALSGRLQTREYQAKDGSNRYITEVVLESFDFINNKKEEQGQQVYKKVKNDTMLDLDDDFTLMVDDDNIPF